MRSITIFFAAIIMIAISSCGSKSGSDATSDKLTFSSAVEYNDFIIGQQELILGEHQACTDALSADNMADAKKNLEKLATQCKASVDTLNKLDAYNENTAFRDAAIKLFTCYKDFAEKGFKEELEILSKEQVTPDDEKRINQIEDDFSKSEGDLYDAFIKAQEKFAGENNMQLINK